jgi:hypothetical protein
VKSQASAASGSAGNRRNRRAARRNASWTEITGVFRVAGHPPGQSEEPLSRAIEELAEPLAVGRLGLDRRKARGGDGHRPAHPWYDARRPDVVGGIVASDADVSTYNHGA